MKAYVKRVTSILTSKHLLMAVLGLFMFGVIVQATTPAHAAPIACTDGTIDDTSEPCIDINADDLAASIFKWAGIFIKALLPIAAIGIGIALAVGIIGVLKRSIGSI